jgi:hypothetical protein
MQNSLPHFEDYVWTGMFAALNGVFGSKVTNNEALQMNH